MPEPYKILGGKVHVYMRPNSSLWQCSSYFAGKNRRTSTKEESLSKAKEIAKDWYLRLRGNLRSGEINSEKHFARRQNNICASTTSSPRGNTTKNTVEVFQQKDSDRYDRIARYSTPPRTQTGLFVPEWGKLFAAVQRQGEQSAELRVYQAH
jgi:hypothetical protein